MFYKQILPNGMRVVCIPMKDRYSASVGIWVKNGSCFEQEHFFGASHYLEHMLFKGTPTRNALQIAEEIENTGGTINAFTGKENTCFYAKCLAENIDTSISVLSDIYCNSLIDEVEFEKEKGVILEEINMYEDDPADLAADRFVQTLWQGHSYGRPVIGTIESVSALKASELRKFYKNVYSPQHTVLAVAGHIEPQLIFDLANKYFEYFQNQAAIKDLLAPKSYNGITYKEKDIEQMHICMGFPAVKLYHEDYYPLAVLNTVLGGGSGSRLFQSAREQRGLTYSIYSYNAAYTLDGYWTAASSAAPEKMQELAKVMLDEFARLKENGISDDELEKAKMQMRGNLLLGQENTNNVMLKAGSSELFRNEIISVEEVCAQIAAVEQADINRIINNIITKDKLVISLVGPENLQIDIPQF